METVKIGLLPLYVKLYDEILPELSGALVPFLQDVVDAFRGRGVEVEAAPICRVERDVAEAIGSFEHSGVEVLVTLHLAYSPSLESADALCRSSLPVLMLDTTPDRDFGPHVDPQRLLYNHGIHGLQDLASVLRRRGKHYEIVAGHLSDSRTMDRACAAMRGLCAATRLRRMRVLRVGDTFAGMGDFQVNEETLEAMLGVHVDQIQPEALLDLVNQVTEADIDQELLADQEAFEVDVDPCVHRRSVRLGLGLRSYLDARGYGAFSMNFLAFDIEDGPLATVPFLECSKAMARGVGYAGEGDVLTAALTGALGAAIGPTTFTEMFCPDWESGAVFISHMGEFNPAVAAAKPRLYEKPFPFTRTNNPAALACAPRPGKATLVTLAPGPDDSFKLIVVPVEVLGDGTHPDYRDWIRGWLKPELPLPSFLESYSRHGGTHHCALMFGDFRSELLSFARVSGFDAAVIDGRETHNE